MKGLSTEDIMQTACGLIGVEDIPPDSGIHHPGAGIKRILFTMDANVGLLHMAKKMGFDAVVGHHPCGVLLKQGEAYRRHLDLLIGHGILRETALEAVGPSLEKIVQAKENRRFRMLYSETPNNTVLEVDAARLLDLPFMNIHNLFDEQGRRILQKKLDEAAGKDPHWKLGDVLALISSLPEAHVATTVYGISPKICLGDPDAGAAKTVFVHGALSAPHPEIIQCYWANGFKTVVMLHGEFEALERLRREANGHLILTGHFLGDSIGMTPFIRALREKGLEVVCTGGIIDVDRQGPPYP